MKQVRSRTRFVALILVLLIISLAVFASYSISSYGNRWFANTNNTRVIAGKKNVIPGKIYDREGNIMLGTDANGDYFYPADVATRSASVHLIGDDQNNISNGVRTFQARYLYGFDMPLRERIKYYFDGKKRQGDDIRLTVSSKFNTYIASRFNAYSNSRNLPGGAVVINYNTGEVMAMTSLPNFDPINIPENIEDDPQTPFYNRVTQSALPPGSTFKTITMSSAIENISDSLSKNWLCTGNLQIDDHVIRDANDIIHGSINLEKAFYLSCNNIFAKVALELDDNQLSKTAENFGFNDNFLFSDIVLENSSYPNDDRDEFELACTGFGQSKLLATPLHMCLVAASIANNGIMMEPKLLQGVTNTAGDIRYTFEPTAYRRTVNANTAAIMDTAMRKVVTMGTGTSAAVSGMTICGKTGTADGMMNGVPATHAWFIAYCSDSDYPYAVCVMVEGGGHGGATAGPIVHDIFQYIKTNY